MDPSTEILSGLSGGKSLTTRLSVTGFGDMETSVMLVFQLFHNESSMALGHLQPGEGAGIMIEE